MKQNRLQKKSKKFYCISVQKIHDEDIDKHLWGELESEEEMEEEEVGHVTGHVTNKDDVM